MKTAILLAALLVVGVLAAAPTVEARDLPCDAYVTPTQGYVACCPVAGFSVSYGGTYRCVPPH